MRYLPILVFALCFFACKSTGKESIQDKTENSIQKVTVDEVTAEKNDWNGKYIFENEGGTSGKWILGNEFELLVNRNPQLTIFSSSMSSPHAELSIEIEYEKGKINILYVEYLKGVGWEDFQKGDLLFSLEKAKGGILTKWEKMKPVYGKLPVEGNYFQFHP